MNTVISIQGINKSYLLNHKSNFLYANFRETLVGYVKNPFKRKEKIETEEFWALKNVSFDVSEGDRIGIIGRNGAGKSTLLKIISRIVEPTSGKIFVKGRVASLLEVGTGFHPELTGRENIFLNGAILGMSRTEIRKNFDDIVDFSGVEKFLDTPVKRYSSGMYVRLAFAVAAHLQPEILIVDEVLAVGDAEFQKKCLGKMNEVSKSGRTILFVSHNMGAINTLCNKAVLLNSGTIQAMGETEKIAALYFSAGNESKGEFKIGKQGSSEQVVVEKVVLRNRKGEIKSDFDFGDNLEIELELNAIKRFEKPYVWVALKSHRGPITNASGLIDGYRSAAFEKGINHVKCTFLNLPLLPGSYTVYMGIRGADGHSLLTDSKDVAIFSVSSVLSESGLNHTIADTISSDSVSPLIPYQWEFNDGKKYSFNINNYVK